MTFQLILQWFCSQLVLVNFNDRSITRLRVGEKRNLSLPVGVLLYNAKVLFRDIKICKLILCKAETLLFLLKVISFSFLNRIVACMLSMAKGIKVGSEVRVLRGKFSTQKGVVQASEGVGRARKWIVKLNGGVLERFSARTLELEQRHLITPPSTSIRAVSQEEEDSCSSNTSSDESSTSDNDEMREVDEDGASRRASDVSER